MGFAILSNVESRVAAGRQKKQPTESHKVAATKFLFGSSAVAAMDHFRHTDAFCQLGLEPARP